MIYHFHIFQYFYPPDFCHPLGIDIGWHEMGKVGNPVEDVGVIGSADRGAHCGSDAEHETISCSLDALS